MENKAFQLILIPSQDAFWGMWNGGGEVLGEGEGEGEGTGRESGKYD